MRKKNDLIKKVVSTAAAASLIAISVSGCMPRDTTSATTTEPPAKTQEKTDTKSNKTDNSSKTNKSAEKSNTQDSVEDNKSTENAQSSQAQSKSVTSADTAAKSVDNSAKPEQTSATAANPVNTETQANTQSTTQDSNQNNSSENRSDSQNNSSDNKQEDKSESKPEEKTYTYTEKVHEPTCTERGYTEHICNEDAARSYNDNFVDAKGHSWDDGVVTKEATIYETGIRTFTCNECGETKTEAIPVVEKTWHKGETVEPTCTSEGYTTYICDQDETLTENRDIVAKVEHDWDDGVVTKEASIYEAGIRIYTCKACGETKEETVPMVEKTWHKGDTVEPTCTAKGYTIYICDQDESLTEQRDFVDEVEHSWDDGVVTTEPTYEAEGIKTFTCSVCGETKTEPIAKLEYTWETNVIAPTCTEQGYTEHICKENSTKNYKDNFVEATGHNWDDGVVTKEATIYETGIRTFTCTDCGETRTEEIPVLEKTWSIKEVVAPTCTDTGYTIYVCDQDETLTEIRDETPAAGHEFDDGEVTTEASYETNGVKTHHCIHDGCSETQTEIIPAKGYTWTEKVVAPTCTEQGYTEHICSENADKNYKDNFVDAIGHDYEEQTVESTCTVAGKVIHVCKNCGDEQLVKTLPLAEHQYNDGVVTKEATFTETGIRTYTCKNCGHTYTEVIPVLEVKEVSSEVVAPTCETEGYTLHTYNDGSTKKTDIVAALGHQFERITTDSTCKTTGSVDDVCSVCGKKVHISDIAIKAEHSWDDGVITTQPTVTAEGVKTFTCTVCGKTKTESIEKLARVETSSEVIEPTCTEQGYTRHYFNDGTYEDDTFVAAHGHDYNFYYKCNYCGQRDPKTEIYKTDPFYHYDEATYNNQIVSDTDTHRASLGLDAYTYASELQALADLRAQEQLEAYGHTRPDGRSCFTVLSDNDVSYLKARENVAWIPSSMTPDNFVTAWLNSPGHKANIEATDCDTYVVGTAYGEYNGNKGVYAVQLFWKSFDMEKYLEEKYGSSTYSTKTETVPEVDNTEETTGVIVAENTADSATETTTDNTTETMADVTTDTVVDNSADTTTESSTDVIINESEDTTSDATVSNETEQNDESETVEDSVAETTVDSTSENDSDAVETDDGIDAQLIDEDDLIMETVLEADENGTVEIQADEIELYDAASEAPVTIEVQADEQSVSVEEVPEDSSTEADAAVNEAAPEAETAESDIATE